MAGARSNYAAVGLLFAIYAFSNLDRFIISILVSPIKADLGVNDFQMSLLMGLAFGVFYSICGLPMGWVTDHFPRKWVIASSTALWSAASLSCGLVSGYAQLFVARMLVGVGESALTPSAYSYLSDSFPKEKLGRALSFFGVAAVVGVSVATLAGGLLLGAFSGQGGIDLPIVGKLQPWQAVFVATGFPALLLAIVAIRLPEPERTGKVLDRKASVADFLAFLRLRRRLAAAIAGSFILMMAGSYSMIVWAPAYLERSFGWSHGRVGLTLGLMFIAFGATGQAFGGITVDRLLQRGHADAALRYFFWSVLIGVPAGIVAFLTPITLVALAGIGIAQFFISAYLGYAASAIQVVTPNEFRGQASALFLFCVNGIACVIGPAIAASLTTHVFQDEGAVGTSVAILLAASGVVAAISAAWGRKYLREAVSGQMELAAPSPGLAPRPA